MDSGEQQGLTSENTNRHRQSPSGSAHVESGKATNGTTAAVHSHSASIHAAPNNYHFTLARRIVTAVVSLWMCCLFMGSHYSEVFQYHPITMTVSFVGLMPEIISLTNVIRRQRTVGDREASISRHMYSSMLMKFFSVIGLIAITINKNARGKHHYTTWHGRIGLATVVILICQVIIGIFYHFRLPGVGPATIGKWRKVHKWLGVGLLVAGCTSMWLGMQTHFVEKAVHSLFVNLLFGTITIAACLVAYCNE